MTRSPMGPRALAAIAHFPVRAMRRSVRRRWSMAAQWSGRALEWILVGLAWALLPLGPLVTSAIARDWSYARRYRPTLYRLAAHLRATLRAHAIARFATQRLTVAARDPQEAVVGSCTHCGNCCLHRSCVFLDYDASGQSRCRIYGGRVWRLLACGDYPSGRLDIELYACPSYAVAPRPTDTHAKVIPIRAHPAAPVT